MRADRKDLFLTPSRQVNFVICEDNTQLFVLSCIHLHSSWFVCWFLSIFCRFIMVTVKSVTFLSVLAFMGGLGFVFFKGDISLYWVCQDTRCENRHDQICGATHCGNPL